jgi:uncharacterized membrane protein YsdA (DUF1294 family)
MIYIFLYLILINLYGLILMYLDKYRSKRGKWRIPESKLFKTAFLFGSLGILAGMQLFRHKTKHIKFIFGIPMILILHIILLYWTVGQRIKIFF